MPPRTFRAKCCIVGSTGGGGHRFVDEAQDDRPYCVWALWEGGPAFGPFSEYMRRQHGGVMSVGNTRVNSFVTYGGKLPDIVHGRWN